MSRPGHFLYGDTGPGPKGSVITAAFQIEGQDFVALNGGPQFKFSPAISFVVNCENQAEVDHCWDKLLADGKAEQCGWLRDKFGVSWQVVPTILTKLITDKDAAKANRVMAAMMKMVKLDIATLQHAADRSSRAGRPPHRRGYAVRRPPAVPRSARAHGNPADR